MSKTRAVRLSRETDVLKLIAIMAMFIDHLGAAIFPGVMEMRIIGRLAFPIFCYTLAAGCCYTRSMGGYALRLLIAALISQPFYVTALNHWNSDMYALTFQQPVVDAIKWYLYSFKTCNIMVALLLGQLLIWTLKDKKYVLSGLMTLLILYIDSTGYITSSYGLKGIILMVLFWALIDRPLASFIWVAGYMLAWALEGRGYNFFGLTTGIQIYALFALPLIYIPLDRHMKMPKAVFYLFYPLHLALLIFLDKMV